MNQQLIDKMKSLNIPFNCPSCNTLLIWKGVDLICNNIDCDTKKVKSLASFIIKTGIEGTTATSLENWNIFTLKDLIAFVPNKDYKSELKFAKEIKDKIFSKTQEELFSCFTFDGAGETNINKLLDFFGKGDLIAASQAIYNNGELTEFPEGIGQKVIDKIKADWIQNIKNVRLIMNDSRWKPVAKVVTTASDKLAGKSFLFTGTLTDMKRNEAEQKVKDNGGIISSSVSKNLTYLVCAEDSWGSSSKYNKAIKCNVNIITEKEFIDLLK